MRDLVGVHDEHRLIAIAVVLGREQLQRVAGLHLVRDVVALGMGATGHPEHQRERQQQRLHGAASSAGRSSPFFSLPRVSKSTDSSLACSTALAAMSTVSSMGWYQV